MSEGEISRRTEDRLAGCFLIVCGLTILFVGGLCTVGWTSFLMETTDGSFRPHWDSLAAAMLLIGILLLAGGFFCIRAGVRMARGRSPGESEGPGEHEPPET